MSVPATIPSVVFPDGTQVFAKDISSLQVSGSNVGVGIGGVWNAYTFAATDSTTAQEIVNQINQVLNGLKAGTVLLGNNSSLVWTSITPNTNSVADEYFGVIAGTGFASLALTNFKADDGAGHTYIVGPYTVEDGFTVNSDASISLIFISGVGPYGGLDPAGTYEIYYSIDGGTNWVDTGLAVTSS